VYYESLVKQLSILSSTEILIQGKDNSLGNYADLYWGNFSHHAHSDNKIDWISCLSLRLCAFACIFSCSAGHLKMCTQRCKDAKNTSEIISQYWYYFAKIIVFTTGHVEESDKTGYLQKKGSPCIILWL